MPGYRAAPHTKDELQGRVSRVDGFDSSPAPTYLQMHITTDFRLAGGALEKRPFAERVCLIEIVPIGDPIAEIADVVAIQ